MHINHLEWESVKWPLKISNIKCEPNIESLPPDSVFEIYRDYDYKLRGRVTGIGFQHSEKINTPSTVYGYGVNIPIKYLIGDVVLGNCKIQQTKVKESVLEYFSQDVYLNFIEEIFSTENSYSIQQYYLSQKLDVFFPRRTNRKQINTYFKVREGEMEEPSFFDDSSGFYSDYMFIVTKSFDFIIQKTESYSPEWSDGVIIEYSEKFRGIPSQEVRTAISEIVGFIFGTHLLKIGETELNKENSVLRRKASSPWGGNVVSKCSQSASPPINIFGVNHKDSVEREITVLINNYLGIYNCLDLSGSLWKLWISKMTPIGADLPILSSAMESLASKYIEVNSLKMKYSKQDKNRYSSIINPIIEQLDKELEGFEFKKRLLNKISNPYQKGGGEILSEFFEKIGVVIDKNSIETIALQSRNKMAHGNIITEGVNLKELVNVSRAYESFFNRVFLIILGYKGKYIDYYSDRLTERPLTSNLSK